MEVAIDVVSCGIAENVGADGFVKIGDSRRRQTVLDIFVPLTSFQRTTDYVQVLWQ